MFSRILPKWHDADLQFKDEISALEHWLKLNPNRTIIEPNRVANEVHSDNPVQFSLRLIALLSIFASRGQLHKELAIRSPNSKTLIDKRFDNIDEIPNILPEGLGGSFSLEDADIVPVFVIPREGVHIE